MLPAANLAISPDSIVLLDVNAPDAKMLDPDVAQL